MNKELRVLVVEDTLQDMALINHELRKAGLRFRSRRVDSRDAFLHELEFHPPDVILSDHGVPGFDGFAALTEARSRCPDAPFIFVTGAPQDEAARQTLRSGADDYVLKSHLNLLAPAVERALRDVSTRANRSRLETELLNTEEQLHLLIEELKEHATFMLDTDGRVASWNPVAAQMLGHEPKGILDHEFGEFFTKEFREQNKPRELLNTADRENRASFTGPLARKSGEPLQAELTIISLRGKAQGMRGFLCIVRDLAKHQISAEKCSEHVAQSEAARREMEKFTHSIALDLRLPLRDIESCSELLVKNAEGRLDRKGQGYLETICASVRRMSRLIDDLFAFSRIGQSEMYHLSLSLKDIAKEVIRDLSRETEGRKIEWVVGDLPEVMGDSVMLWQVMTNLISNAVKFTRQKEQARIEIGAIETGREHVIFVRDNGAGFDSACSDRLFGAFQRLHGDEFEGTGVGLANVRRIIERHGGRVWAEGVVSEGAAFYFALPR
jgi:PAS domain S-box-containing protein